MTAAHAQVKMNEGMALLYLAGTYATLNEAILELVQNALDKDVNASKIWITINFRSRNLSVRDNGNGTTIAKFNAALSSVAERGRKGEGSLGQFGLGLISLLGKCKEFVFTSCPAPHMNGFNEWTINTKDITEQSENLRIPVRTRSDLTLSEHPSRGQTRVQWRSEMKVKEFTTDNFISRVQIDDLINAIKDRYSTTMRRNQTNISVEITDKNGKVHKRDNVSAPEFQGTPLPEKTFENAESGKNRFRLFVAKKTATGRKGRVQVGVLGNDYNFPFHLFARAATGLLDDSVIKALSSGLFEGEILSEKVTLHPSRRSFVKDDAWSGMCVAIQEWFDTCGSRYIEEMQQTQQEERFQDLGLRSLKVLDILMKESPAFAGFRDVINSFGRGTIGSGHTDLDKKVVGQQDKPSVAIQGKHKVDPIKDFNDPRLRGEPQDEKKNHVPLTAAGPNGQPRKIVRNSSFGLQFRHEPMEGSNDLWKLDVTQGILTFNIRHTHFVACMVKDTTLMKLHEHIAMQALTLQMMPENLRHLQRQFADEFNHSFVPWILSSDKLRANK